MTFIKEVSMKKRHIIGICTAALLAIILILSLNTPLKKHAGKLYAFDDPDDPSFDSRRRSSIDDCRAYAANFQSAGWLDDKAAFQDRFGPPMRVNEPVDNEEQVMDFMFDNYTRITLDCAGDTCKVRCSSRF